MVKVLDNSAQNLLTSIEKVDSSAKENKWVEADQAFKDTEKKWTSIKKYWPLLIHHQEMDRIEECMSKLKSYIQYHEKSDTLAEIYVLDRYIQHIPENKSLNLQNIF
jgi:NurA-like 5'-3' nuclease